MKIRIKKKLQSLEEAKPELDPYINDVVIPGYIPDELSSGNKTQLQAWLKNIFQKDESEREAAMAYGVNPVQRELLSKFYKMLLYIKRKTQNDPKKITGINSITNFENLKQLINQHENRYKNDPTVKNRELKDEIERLKDEAEIEQLPTQEGSKYEIFIPRTKGGAIILGQMCNAKWCTSAASAQNMFDSYYEEHNPLFILKEKSKTDDGAMYQIHFGKQEFKDQFNKDVGTEKKQELVNAVKTALGEKVEEFPAVKTSLEEMKPLIIDHGDEIIFYLEDPNDRDNEIIHRKDGPAIINKRNKTVKWALNNNYYIDPGMRTDSLEPPKSWLEAGGLGWDKENDPYWKQAQELQEHFRRFSKLWL